MHPNYYLSPLAVAVALVITSPAKAAEPLSLGQASFAEIQQQFSLSIPENKQLHNVSSADNLEFIKQYQDGNKTNHVRMQQKYLGFSVFGGYAILHSKLNPKALTHTSSQVTMNGKIYRGLKSELGAAPIDFVKNKAKALQHFQKQYQNEQVSEAEVIPLVYIDNQNQAHWAYKVSVLVHYKNTIPARPTAVIDAQSYQPFVQWNQIKTAFDKVKGIGFGGNSKVGEYAYGTDLDELNLTRDAENQMCFMENTQVKVVDMKHKFSGPNVAMSFACEHLAKNSHAYFTGYQGDGYDRYNGAASPSNDALYAGHVIKHLFEQWYHVDVLTQANGSPMQLVMRVHYGEGYENAYWDGRQMTFGDGETTFYPLSSLDVGAHEIGHGFTEQHSGLMGFGQSAGMDESFSDITAQAAEFYVKGSASFKIGAGIVKEDSGYEALRFMDVPSRDGRSIDTAADYYGGLNSHYSSGVYNRLFYILANKAGWTVKSAFDVLVKANMAYWTPYTTFEEGGCGLLKAAADLHYSIKDVKDSLQEVAVNTDACGKESR